MKFSFEEFTALSFYLNFIILSQMSELLTIKLFTYVNKINEYIK